MSLAEDLEYWSSAYDFDYGNIEIFSEYLQGNLFWNTKDGKRINIKDMEESHIRNIMRITKYRNKENWDLVFKFELENVRKCK
jgi:hypothetical protein